MFSVEGYFDGAVCVPLAELPVRQNQRVLITVLEDSERRDQPDGDFVACGLQLLSEITGSINGDLSLEEERLQYFKERHGNID